MYIKLGNLTIHKDAGKTMTFDQFKATYTGVLKGMDFEKAYKAIGGSIEAPAKKAPKKSTKKAAEKE